MNFNALDLPMLIILVAGGLVYFMPWFIAALRHHHRRVMIGLLNLLFGWTLIGWVGTFLWAISKTRPATKESIEDEGMEESLQASPPAARKYSQAS